MLTLCKVSELPEGSSTGFRLGQLSCFAIRKDDAIHVYANSCPHLGVELEWLPDQFLNSDETLIQCATHGALFLIDSGLCVAGPCLGQQLRALPFTIVDDQIVLSEP